jgi:triose-phosphate isomerase
MSRTFFVGGNWKMNGSIEQYQSLIKHLLDSSLDSKAEVVIAPPSLYLLPSQKLLEGKQIALGAQNAYNKPSGAFTGEISVAQLKDASIPWVILGHSERRSIFGETDDLVAQKTSAALETGLSVILCVGESLEQREKNESINVVLGQLETATKDVKDWSKIVIAYEPVWAIGTGKVATAEQAQEVHAAIRQWLVKKADQQVSDTLRIIYGGSVAAKNCKELASQPDIDGFLVGGASLKPEFVDIVNARL